MRTPALPVAVAALTLAACEDSSSSSSNSGTQYQGEAQSQLGRTAEMGRNLADKIEGRDANIGTAAEQAMGGDGLVSIPGLQAAAPDGWTQVTPDNQMRLAQFEAGNATVTVSQAGGSTDANIDRWLGQFVDQYGQPNDPADRYERTVAGFDATVIETFGAYLEGAMFGTPQRRENYGLVGAVIETPGASTFIKMTGPEVDIEEQREAFDRFLDAFRTN